MVAFAKNTDCFTMYCNDELLKLSTYRNCIKTLKQRCTLFCWNYFTIKELDRSSFIIIRSAFIFSFLPADILLLPVMQQNTILHYPRQHRI